MSDLLPCVEAGARADARAAVIWLHGLGADGHDFVPLVPLLGVDDLHVRFVFPHAPSIPVSINGGFVMPAWYDIRQMDLQRSHDLDGVRASSERVGALLRREIERGVPAARIVLAGFSQGGAIALDAGLCWPERLAGVMALSTYLVDEDGLRRHASPANADVPIFMAHGTHDPMVPFERGRAAQQRLTTLGYPVAWHSYPMQHQVCQDEIDDIGAWLRECLG